MSKVPVILAAGAILAGVTAYVFRKQIADAADTVLSLTIVKLEEKIAEQEAAGRQAPWDLSPLKTVDEN